MATPQPILRTIYNGTLRDVNLRAGVEGNYQTLRRMRAFVLLDYAALPIVETAQDIVKNLRGHDFRGEIETLFRYCRDQIRYVRDPEDEQVIQNAAYTTKRRAGDCVDKSVLLATLCAAIGHTPRFVTLSYDTPQAHEKWFYRHVFCEVMDSQTGKWIALDPTPENYIPGQESASLHRATFPIFTPEQANQLAG